MFVLFKAPKDAFSNSPDAKYLLNAVEDRSVEFLDLTLQPIDSSLYSARSVFSAARQEMRYIPPENGHTCRYRCNDYRNRRLVHGLSRDARIEFDRGEHLGFYAGAGLPVPEIRVAAIFYQVTRQRADKP